MNLETKMEILECYILSNKSTTAALRLYKKRRNLIKDPFTTTTIAKLMTKFYETGSLLDKERSGRRSLVDERIDSVKQAVEQTSTCDYSTTSIRQISASSSIPTSSVHRILKQNLKMWPYKISLVQELKAGDPEKRLLFREWLLNNESDLPNILWSDECNFYLNGNLNRHNCRIWSTTNPHKTTTTALHSPHICVWMGFSSRFGLRPYFFDGTVNAQNYLEMIMDHMVPELKKHRALSRTIFMQDGAPPHFASSVRDFLKQQFQNRVISRGCDVVWPPRSPDLNPLDYWLWGMLKSKIYSRIKPTSIEHLKELIREACANLTVEEYACAVAQLHHRLDLLFEVNGSNFEQYM